MAHQWQMRNARCAAQPGNANREKADEGAGGQRKQSKECARCALRRRAREGDGHAVGVILPARAAHRSRADVVDFSTAAGIAASPPGCARLAARRDRSESRGHRGRERHGRRICWRKCHGRLGRGWHLRRWRRAGRGRRRERADRERGDRRVLHAQPTPTPVRVRLASVIRSFESSPPPCGSHLMERAKGRGHEDECARSATL